VVAGAATIVAFLGLDGSLSQNIHGFRSALNAIEDSYNVGPNATFDNSSVYGWLQAIGYATGGLHDSLVVRNAIKGFIGPGEVLTALLMGWYLSRREQSLWRAVTLITLWLLLVPDVVYYYQLLFLFVPLALFAKYAQVHARSLRIACLFGLILAPKAYFYFGTGLVDSSTLITAPLLVALAVYIIRDGHIERKASALSDARSSTSRPEMVHG
jgi:hypothetical protein